MKSLNDFITEKLKIAKDTHTKKDIIVVDSLEELKYVIEQETRKNGNECDLNHIDISNLDTLDGLFEDSAFNGDISKWDTSNVVSMVKLFSGSDFDGDIGGWDVSKVEDMSHMFEYSEFEGDISDWDVRNVKDMSRMFERSIFKGSLQKWYVSNVVNMTRMFNHSEYKDFKSVDYWEPDSLKYAKDMFDGSPLEDDLPEWYQNFLKQNKA